MPTAMCICSPYDSNYLVNRLVGAAGFDVLRVCHNENIVERLEESPRLDLVVLDSIYMNFAGNDPAKFMEKYVQIKVHPKTQPVPFILVTRENEFDRELLARVGADRHITYPIDPGEFVRTIEGYLSK
jgi:CheY-like chemotaxis protein